MKIVLSAWVTKCRIRCENEHEWCVGEDLEGDALVLLGTVMSFDWHDSSKLKPLKNLSHNSDEIRSRYILEVRLKICSLTENAFCYYLTGILLAFGAH
jgi:hypothetical protein